MRSMLTPLWEILDPPLLHVNAVADPGFWLRGTKLFLRKFPDVAKRSHMNEVSFNRPGSRAYLWALEALGFFFAEYAFSLFSG